MGKILLFCILTLISVWPASPTNPAGIIHSWNFENYTLDQFDKQYTEVAFTMKGWTDKVAATGEISYSAVLKPLLECFQIYKAAYNFSAVGSIVAESHEKRSFCIQRMHDLFNVYTDTQMRKDIFTKLCALRDMVNNGSTVLGDEHRRCLSHLILTGQRNGLELGEEVQTNVKNLENQITQLEVEYKNNFYKDDVSVEFLEAELDGISDELKMLFKKNPTNTYSMSSKSPDINKLISRCSLPNVRKKLETASSNRCSPRNGEIVKELVTKRRDYAVPLGYATYADYVQKTLMAKNPNNVDSFLNDLVSKVAPYWEEDMKMMLDKKKVECEIKQIAFDKKINMWDYTYYNRLIKEDSAKLADLKEYFALQNVLEGIFKLLKQVLQLQFNAVENAETWNENVRVYQVEDLALGDSKIIGYFYLDLYKRDEEKSNQWKTVPMQQGCLDVTGQRIMPAVLLNFVFSKPKNNKPVLLTMGQLQTFFFMVGRGLNLVCCKAETAIFNGTSTERDFANATADMMKNWLYEKESLKFIAKHHKTQEPLTESLLNHLVNSSKQKNSLAIVKQIVLAKIDLQLHWYKQTEDPLETCRKVYKEVMKIDVSENTNPLATFSHLVDNYDAVFYGYLWGEVYAQDMFEKFKSDGVISSKVGSEFRKHMLEDFGKPGLEMLKNFLGREPSVDAYLESRGLTSKA